MGGTRRRACRRRQGRSGQTGILGRRALEFARQPEIAQALELQAQGKGDEAIAALRSAELNYQSNPHFHFLLGSALQNQDKSVEAFKEFRKSVKLRKDYGQDRGLRQAVLNAAQLEGSEDALQEYLRDDADQELIHEVYALATSDLDRKPRERVASLLKGDGVFSRLPREKQVAVEVRSTRSCKDLKPFADEAIGGGMYEVLTYLNDLPKRGCGFLNRSDCYSCIRKEVQEAAKSRGLTSSK